jgi:hypothetical protein
MSICKVQGCAKPAVRRGWCYAHYKRWRRHGDPLGGRTANGEPQKFIDEVVLPYAEDACLTWPFACAEGRAQIRNGGKAQFVARLVCEAVHGPAPSEHHHAAHSCGRGGAGCVNPKHLRWATPSENNMDKVGHGTHNRGERNPNHKLTEGDVRQIRALRYVVPQNDLADQFDVHVSTIAQLQSGRYWAWLT